MLTPSILTISLILGCSLRGAASYSYSVKGVSRIFDRVLVRFLVALLGLRNAKVLGALLVRVFAYFNVDNRGLGRVIVWELILDEEVGVRDGFVASLFEDCCKGIGEASEVRC